MAEETTPEDIDLDAPDPKDVGTELGSHFDAPYVGEILNERLEHISSCTEKNINSARKLLPYFTTRYVTVDQRQKAEEYLRKIYEEQEALSKELAAVFKTLGELPYQIVTFDEF